MNQLRRVSSLPALRPGAIEEAVENFVTDSLAEESGADPVGLYNQTIECIASATYLGGGEGRQFWLADQDGEVLTYVLAHVGKDVDNQLCYWLTQAYVHPKLRGQKVVKEWFQLLRQEAKRLLCKHIIIPSSRSTKAYLRFLGDGWHEYVTLLKEDI